MLVSLTLITATLVAILLIALLWRRECRRQGVAVRPYVFWFPALLGLIAAMVFISLGMPAGVLQLLGDMHNYRPQAERLIAGEPLDHLERDKLPLLGLIHALQARLEDEPSAAGWAALSQLYAELTRQTALDASDMAVQAAKRSLALAPDDVSKQLLLAQTLIEANDGKLSDDSRQLLDQVLKQRPDYDGAWLLLAMAAARNGQYPVAEQAFRVLIAHHPDDKASALLKQSLVKLQAQQQRADHFARIQITVRGDKAGKLTTGGTLFVFVQQDGASGKPLAAKRVLLDRLPMTITLVRADWLGDLPAVDARLQVGARYATGAAASVADSRLLASAPLKNGKDGLMAELTLP